MISTSFIFVILSLVITVAEGTDCLAPLKDCSTDYIQFFLYTAVDQPPLELKLADPASVTNAKFIDTADFKFLIHGYTQWKNAPEWVKVREEYFKQKPWNLLVVDYNAIAKWGCYFDTLRKSIEQIGRCIGDLLRLIFKEHPKITIDRFHFIGFSMGSQICAQVANNLQSSGMIIPRITGCDPAGPGFYKIECSKRTRLNREHAKFVDAIHSNMGQAGVSFSDAHFDFYANKGTTQPGCKFSDPGCSHNRAIQIFAETINSPVKIIAQKCDSEDAWIENKKCTGDHAMKREVGEHCEPPKSDAEMGIYQFDTNEAEPFATAAVPPPQP